MDYLHYMNYESENFALIVYPLLILAYYHHSTSFGFADFTWGDFRICIFSSVIRVILLVVFMRITACESECIGFGSAYTYRIISGVSLALYAGDLIYYITTENNTLFC